MLGKDKKNEMESAPSSFTKTMAEKSAPPAKPAPSPGPVPTEEKTVIGEQISVEGNIRGTENLIIEGSLKGNIEMENHNFTVGSKGRVDGKIKANNIIVSGQLQGKIEALGKVEITKEADFHGEIKSKSISVEDGAYFKGVIELAREPHRKGAFTGKETGPTNVTEPLKPSIPVSAENGKGS